MALMSKNDELARAKGHEEDASCAYDAKHGEYETNVKADKTKKSSPSKDTKKPFRLSGGK